MAAITSAAIGIATSAYQIGENISQRNKAKQELEDFNRQELTNPYEGIQVDTTRADQMTKANLINVATSVDALQRLGERGVLAGIPRLNESSILLQDKISEDISRQQRENDLLIAKGEEELQRIRENREQQALLGIGQELNVANQNIVTGFGDIVSSGLAFGNALGSLNKNNNAANTLDSSLISTGIQSLNPTNPITQQKAGVYNSQTGIIEDVDPITGLPVFDNNRLNFFRNKR